MDTPQKGATTAPNKQLCYSCCMLTRLLCITGADLFFAFPTPHPPSDHSNKTRYRAPPVKDALLLRPLVGSDRETRQPRRGKRIARECDEDEIQSACAATSEMREIAVRNRNNGDVSVGVVNVFNIYIRQYSPTS